MEFLWIHILGFLMQIVPCMILCFLPFYNLSFVKKRKKELFLFCGIAFLCALLFALGLYLFVMINPSLNPALYGNLYMMVFVAIFGIMYFHHVKEPGIKKTVVINIVVFYASAQYMLVNMLINLFPQENIYGVWVYCLQDIVCYLVTGIILFPVVAKMMAGTVRTYLYEIGEEYMKQEFHNILLISFLYFIQVIAYTIFLQIMETKWLICGIFLFVTIIMLLFYRALFSNAVIRQHINEYQEYEKIQQLQYQKITQEMGEFRRMHHDLRHHIRVLYEMSEQEEYQQIHSYLQELQDTTDRRQMHRFCDNLELNALLQYYIGRAEESGISCKVEINCDNLAISAVDLTIMLGNILENAIGANEQRTEEQWIELSLAVVGLQLIIQVKNSCDKVCVAKTYENSGEAFLPAEAFISTRQGGGQGLKSIVVTAKKYDGEAKFCYDWQHHSFITRIRLNLPKK